MSGVPYRSNRPSALYVGKDRWDSESKSIGPEGAAMMRGSTSMGVGNYPVDIPRLDTFDSFNLGYPVENEPVGIPRNSFHANYNSLYNAEYEINTPLSRLLGPRPTFSSRIDHRHLGFAAAGDLFQSCEDYSMDLEERDYRHAPWGSPPAWNKTRPYLTGQHHWMEEAGQSPRPNSSLQHSPSMQEAIIVEDLLYGFMGLGGQYLHFKFEENEQGRRDVRCTLVVELESSLQAKVAKVLSVCEDVVVLQRFIETRLPFESGVVSHAVAAAMRHMLDDWMLMVTQLESLLRTGRLTMQSLWYYIQAPLITLQLLASIARKAASDSLVGPKLLNLIHINLEDYAGDRNAQVLLRKLLVSACIPYFKILEKWLCEGLLDDPYDEFMICENPEVTKAHTTEHLESKYWHERYTIRKEDSSGLNVPVFLERYQEMILKTGKYLNAIRECGLPVQRPLDQDERIAYDSSGTYIPLVHKAHRESSRAFMNLFMRDLRLVSWLRCIKHFFLNDRGDMISHLMDIADEEFRKAPGQISHTRLQSLMELAVRTSSVPSHANSEPLSFEFDPLSLVEMVKGVFSRRKPTHASFRSSMRSSMRGSMRISKADEEMHRIHKRSDDAINGFDVFMMTYRVDWPMTLIAPEKQMLRYRLLFKHLFLLKRVERELGKSWHTLQPSKRVSNRETRGILQRTCLLCHNFMHTIQMYFRFFTVEILEPEWNVLEAEVAKAQDVDRVIEVHKQFVSRVLRRSLVRKLKVITQLEGIERDALRFSNLIHRSIRIEEAIEPPPRQAQERRQRQEFQRGHQNQGIEEAVLSREFQASITTMENSYRHKMDDLIIQMKSVYDITSNKQHDIDADGPQETREDLDCLMNLVERLSLRG